VFFFALSAVSVAAIVVLVGHLGEETTGLPVGPSFLQGAKGVGIGLFTVLALVGFLVGKAFVGERIVRALRRRRGR